MLERRAVKRSRGLYLLVFFLPLLYPVFCLCLKSIYLNVYQNECRRIRSPPFPLWQRS